MKKYECLFDEHKRTHIHDKKLYTLHKLSIYAYYERRPAIVNVRRRCRSVQAQDDSRK